MPRTGKSIVVAGVALLAEGVDRNNRMEVGLHDANMSPSSRRAWIEIRNPCSLTSRRTVALLAEGVDRNYYKVVPLETEIGRPPRGGRG
mgnify:CR=1 FL=1